MLRTITFIIISIILLSSFNKTRNTKPVITCTECETSWNYFSLTDTLKGSVLFHAKAPFTCGVLATASLTIVKTDNNDTIRVLWLCNKDVVFKKASTVKVYPEKKPNFGVLFPNKKSKYDCSIKNTCYGTIE
ncbi:MAG: hypothetical protein IPK31_17900 [Chitinophagaceae bacterium]|nr:hypothetical protein [Chitinophagaceae bacterium]